MATAQQEANRALWEAAYQARQVDYATYLNAYNVGYFASPPPGGGAGGGAGSQNLLGQANVADIPAGTEWEVDPRQAYLSQLGIGPMGLTPYQQWQRAQFNPTYATYLAQSQLNPATGGVPGTFGNYLAGTGIQGARQTAPGLFGQLGQVSPENQRSFWENLGSFANDLMSNVLGQRYGTPIASQMGQNFGALQSAFQGGPGYANPQASFLEYLRQKYNL